MAQATADVLGLQAEQLRTKLPELYHFTSVKPGQVTVQ